MSRRAVILVAGGTGTRMKSPLAKQFLEIGGMPIIIHTFEAFYRFDNHLQCILVLYSGLEAQWAEITRKFNFQIQHVIVKGGEERFHSVKNGIDAITPDVELVAIHDAVRPLVSSDTIKSCFAAAEKYGAAIPTTPVTDTIRRVGENGSITLPRNQLVAVQTPQCFRVDILKMAYQTEFSSIFTDDASVVEYAGFPVHLTEGNRTNIKITTPEDLLVAESLLAKEKP